MLASVAMGDLVMLERALAGVLTLGELAGGALDQVKALAGASDAMVFTFDESRAPASRGGSLTEVMRGYTPDLFHEDLLQAYSLALPASTFVVYDRHGDFDFRGHIRSRPYADFYRPNGIGYVYALWPTGLSYGSPGMFGVFLCTPKVSCVLETGALTDLGRLEESMRAAARRIARFSALENERDVLRHLVGAERGVFVIWDQDTRLVWASPAAARFIAGKSERVELERLAAVATRQLRGRPDARPVLFSRPTQIETRRGESFLAEFCLIETTERRPWLLAELSACDGVAVRLAGLTAAEGRVLTLLERGLTNREIGASLFVSNETVRTHVSRILHKLGVDTRSKAASLARDAWRGRSDRGVAR
jgi:DNA-binding CsgD family transcriptional regulator